jgi:hypothetical protein
MTHLSAGIVLTLAATFAACSSKEGRGGGVDTATGGGAIGTGGSLAGTGGSVDLPDGVITPECEKDCEDFPAEPIVEGVSAAEQAALDGAPSGAGPCIVEPANGTMFPAYFTRPRFNFPAGKVSKITLSAAKEKNQLVVYTTSSPWYLPKDIWEGLSKNVLDEDITYTIRTGDGAGAPTETTGVFRVAPVAAGGSMVFWGSTGTLAGVDTNKLYGFGVGDEGVIEALIPGDIGGVAISQNALPRNKDGMPLGKSTCVGCHSSTPDGKAVATGDDWEWNIRISSIEEGTRGQAPDFLTPAGAGMASMTWLGATTFSAADWATGARRMVTTWSVRELAGNEWKTHDGSVMSNEPTELVMMDLASTTSVPVDLITSTPETYKNDNQGLQKALAPMQGTDWKLIVRDGDTQNPVLPDWSHDGKNIVYTSTDVPQDGRIGQATSVDIFTVSLADGAAAGVSGASSADFYEYYPDYAPDDSLIAFNRVPTFTTSGGREDSFNHVYYRPDSDIYVVPSAGGEPVRLVANDAACPSEGATGSLYNSWAKWSPSTATDDSGRTFYFVIFSTSRNSPFAISRGQGRTSPASQLYMATVVKNADGSLETYPAIYLWNQRNLVDKEGNVTQLGTNNVTPAWDQFKIPPVPPIIIK